MKLRYIFTAFVAALALSACQKEATFELEEVQVSSSYVALPIAGGSVKVTVNAQSDWEITPKTSDADTVNVKFPEWLTISPLKGGAGETEVTFTAAEGAKTVEADLYVACGGRRQAIKVMQVAGKVELPLSSCAQVLAAKEGSFRVKGTCVSINNTQYGNWYLNDGTGELYIYGTLDKSGAEKNFLSLGIEAGDIVECQGPLTIYNGTYELVNVEVLSITKSLIKAETAPVSLEKSDSTFVVELTCKGDGMSVDIPADAQSWLALKGISLSGTSAKATFAASANESGARSAELVFKTSKGGVEYSAKLAVSQEGSIVECTIAEFLAQPVGKALFKLTGRVQNGTALGGGRKFDLATYGNFELVDATGHVYVYGVTAAPTADGKNDKSFATLGIKEGDIVTIIGTRAEYNGTAQVGGTSYFVSRKPVTKITCAAFNALADDANAWYELTGVVTDGTAIAGHKFDLATYGNFDIVDATGDVYVYGLTTGWGGPSKACAQTGIKAGDSISIVAHKASYKGDPQAGSAFFVRELTAK